MVLCCCCCCCCCCCIGIVVAAAAPARSRASLRSPCCLRSSTAPSMQPQRRHSRSKRQTGEAATDSKRLQTKNTAVSAAAAATAAAATAAAATATAAAAAAAGAATGGEAYSSRCLHAGKSPCCCEGTAAALPSRPPAPAPAAVAGRPAAPQKGTYHPAAAAAAAGRWVSLSPPWPRAGKRIL